VKRRGDSGWSQCLADDREWYVCCSCTILENADGQTHCAEPVSHRKMKDARFQYRGELVQLA